MVVSVRSFATQAQSFTPAHVQASVKSPPFSHFMATVISFLLQFGELNVFVPLG
jgi:hypothetical protein